ncbi:site-specific integrase [Listeria sp. ILCC792]|uniref:tyrosine-type recombinase/integrase n=1 Tax=Listeria sp. ILCC792 TaxID=1918331 RepID=UPI000B58AA5E|nr:site-specific integrase [Listeria sp. ILCC792]
MWIEELANGKYKFVERYNDPLTEKNKKASITLASNSNRAKKEAQRLLDDKISVLLKKQRTTEKSLTFNEVYEQWKPLYQKQVKWSTYFSTVQVLDGFIKVIGEDALITKITSQYLIEELEDLIYGERKLSNRSTALVKSKVKLVFEFAKRRGYIVDNPIDKVSIQYSRNTDNKTKTKFLEDEEYAHIVEYTEMKNERYALLFQFLYYTGLRAGEALSLTQDNVVLENEHAYIIVNGTLEYKGKKIHEQEKSTTTKTSAGMREVDLPTKAVQLLKQIHQLNAAVESDFIFSTSRGTPIQITAINTFLRKAKKDLNIDKPLSSHIFRHTHVSKLAELGTPLFAIQDRVGHENSKITEQIYLHITKGIREKVKDNIERL